jgi:WD40 repeat protein
MEQPFQQHDDLVTCSPSQGVRVWDSESLSVRTQLGRPGVAYEGFLPVSGGRELILWSRGGVEVWTGPSSYLELEWDGATKIGCALSEPASRESGPRLLAAWSMEGSIQLWDLAGPSRAWVPLRGHSDVIESCVFDSGRERLVSASRDGTLCRWNLDRLMANPPFRMDAGETDVEGPSIWREPDVLKGHEDWVIGVDYLDSGGFISWSLDKTLRIWPEAGSSESKVLRGHPDEISVCKVHRQGRSTLVASADRSGNVIVWGPLPQVEQEQVSLRLNSPVEALEFIDLDLLGPPMLVTGSRDGAVRLWELERGACLGSFLALGSIERLVIRRQTVFAADALGNLYSLAVSGSSFDEVLD